jgi:hypothetical protein
MDFLGRKSTDEYKHAITVLAWGGIAGNDVPSAVTETKRVVMEVP